MMLLFSRSSFLSLPYSMCNNTDIRTRMISGPVRTSSDITSRTGGSAKIFSGCADSLYAS
jgi:hypothetical protein